MGITSDLSGDGGSFAFVSTKYDTTVSSSMMSVTQQIYLYDKENEVFLEVDGSQELSNGGNWLYSIPSISSDGRYLAYSQTTSPESGIVGICHEEGGPICPDIYIFDRQNGMTGPITHGQGEAANGASLNPVISADGSLVVFWSMASNLTEDDTELCALMIHNTAWTSSI
jgi:Tol biopolymer transport system component